MRAAPLELCYTPLAPLPWKVRAQDVELPKVYHKRGFTSRGQYIKNRSALNVERNERQDYSES